MTQPDFRDADFRDTDQRYSDRRDSDHRDSYRLTSDRRTSPDDEAESQARGYLVSLPPKFRPPMIVISDFKRMRVIDVLLNKTAEFNLEDLSSNLNHIEIAFGIAKKQEIHIEVEVDECQIINCEKVK